MEALNNPQIDYRNNHYNRCDKKGCKNRPIYAFCFCQSCLWDRDVTDDEIIEMQSAIKGAA